MLERGFDYEFLIDGKPILICDEDSTDEGYDLDSEETGRDEAGNMHRYVLLEDVKKWVFPYDRLTKEEYQYLRSLIKGKPEFTFEYRDDEDQPAMCIAYNSNRSITVHNRRLGIYKNFKLTIIEARRTDV